MSEVVNQLDDKLYVRAGEEYLLRLGYQIIGRNYRCKAGQVELVAKDGSEVVMVAIKRERIRRDKELWGSMGRWGVEQLMQIKDQWTDEYAYSGKVRIDVLSIWIGGGETQLEQWMRIEA